jgi:DNA-binding CsgD family transcriptional regulator
MESVSLPAARIRELLRLVGEVRELSCAGLDPAAHATEGFRRLIAADAAGSVRGPAVLAMDRMELSGFSPDSASAFQQFYLEHDRSEEDPAVRALVRTIAPGETRVARRCELVPDRDWYRSPYLNHWRRACGLDDSIYGSLFFANGTYTGLAGFRTFGGRPFDEIDRGLAHLFVESCAERLFTDRPGKPLGTASWQHLASLADRAERAPLTPRQGQVLEALLAGLSPKEIAVELSLSVNTVRQYVKEIYRAEGVTSRGELMARRLGR